MAKANYKYIVIFIAIVGISILIDIILKDEKFYITIMNILDPLNYIKYTTLKEEYPTKDTNIPLYVFYHICTKNMKIVDEQMLELVNSGLYSTATKLFYGCNCSSCDTILEEYMKQYERFEPIPSAILPDTKTYENGTLNSIISYAKGSKEKFYALYIHTKGTSAVSETQESWRRLMMYWLVTNYRLCIDILNRDFYTVGVLYTRWLRLHPRHYSGNFWWASSEYLKTLDPIQNQFMSDRFYAEFLLFTKYQEGRHVTILKELGYFIRYMFRIEIRPTENPDIGIL